MSVKLQKQLESVLQPYIQSFKRNSNIRFDFALRLANELQIDVNEICSASPFSGTIKEEEIYPTLPDGLNGARCKSCKDLLKKFYVSVDVSFGKTVCLM